MKKIRIIFLISISYLIILLNCSEVFASTENNTKIYFLSQVNNLRYEETGEYYADCMLLENYDNQSNEKKFALIDTGTTATGESVVNFLRNKGVEKLEFIIVTHCHLDHMGALQLILENFEVDTLYIQECDQSYVRTYVSQPRYDLALKFCAENNIKIIGPSIFYGPSTTINENNRIYNDSYVTAFNEENTQFNFGSAKIQIMNWQIQYGEDGNRAIRTTDNENSLGILITQGNKKAFLAGDINDVDGDEDRLGNQIGKIDFIKLGHHGNRGSNTNQFLAKLLPEYAIITNDYSQVYSETLNLLKKYEIEYHFSTQDETAVIAEITDNNVSIKYEHANCEKYISGEWVYVEDIWAPEINVTYSTKDTTNTFVEATIKSNEELQEVSGWTLSDDKLSLSKKYIENTTEIVIVRDLTGNESTAYVEVSNIKNSDEFSINMIDDKYILAGIDYENNTVKRFLQMADFDGIYDIKMYRNSVDLKNNDIITTGTILRLYNKENDIYQDYTIILYGDTNGDGKFTAIDALLVIKNKIGENELKDEIYIEAGRVTEVTRNEKLIPNSADALAIVSAKLNNYTIQQ